MDQNPATVTREILARYADYDAQSRLSNTRSVGFEFLRSQELILRHTQTPPQKVLDVGGSPGVYSLWLASLEYEVHLMDGLTDGTIDDPYFVNILRGTPTMASTATPGACPITSRRLSCTLLTSWKLKSQTAGLT